MRLYSLACPFVLQTICGSIQDRFAKYATYICIKQQSKLFSAVGVKPSLRSTEIQVWDKAVAIIFAIIVREGTVLVNFEEKFFISNNAVSPLLYFLSRPRVSILSYFSGSVGGNSPSSIACIQSLMRLQAHGCNFSQRGMLQRS